MQLGLGELLGHFAPEGAEVRGVGTNSGGETHDFRGVMARPLGNLPTCTGGLL